MNKSENLPIRPYARLLTMLGEQLIKNERIALIELIKNSYDADAEWVKVSFVNFGENYKIQKNSKIIIEDNGFGMTEEIVKKHWLNPATPEKKKRKEKKATTPKGRIIQGEKGIGRFAILKLGRKIDIVTRTLDTEYEFVISYDFSKYDDDFLTEDGKEKELFLEDLLVAVESRNPERIVKSNMFLGTRKRNRDTQGTIIEISNLKGSWSEKKVEMVYKDLTKLESIFTPKGHSEFEVFIYKDDKITGLKEDYREKLELLLTDRSVIKVENGYFDAERMEYVFTIFDKGKKKKEKISLLDPTITGLNVFKRRFDNAGAVLENRKLECGSFEFGFYVFDLVWMPH